MKPQLLLPLCGTLMCAVVGSRLTAQDNRPVLIVRSIEQGKIILGWPSLATGFVLECSTDVYATSLWQTVVDSPRLEDGWLLLPVAAVGNGQFFRLRSVYADGLPPDPAEVASAIDRTAFPDLGTTTAFLYTGPNPIQLGVAPSTIEPRRAAVVRGQVLTGEGDPLPGVHVSIVGHVELGSTLSRTDGRFDLAVNGGDLLTLNYQKAGFLPAQRQLRVPWQVYREAPTVALIALDRQVTTIQVGSTAPLQVARGTPTVDADGARQATLLFTPGTEANILRPDGSVQPLAQLHVRATEFTVGPGGPLAMPADLPPGVGYTYAVSLTADEALADGVKRAGQDVWFSQPVVFYIENFLEFPVGTVVPLGYYDDARTAWVPYDNGRVVRILGVTGDRADLDADGNGAADDAAQLAALGVTDQERTRLATLYPPGQSLWRMTLSHFSIWDANWLWGPILDAVAPMIPANLLDFFTQKHPRDPCAETGWSVVNPQSQVLSESFPVSGTPFRLAYASDRTPGRLTDRVLEIPLSLEILHPQLRRIDLEVSVAGRLFTHSAPPLPNQVYRIAWDGQDAYGRQVPGAQRAKVRVGYAYAAQYYETKADLDQAFGYRGNGVPITANAARQEFVMWQEWEATLGPWDARAQGLGGWTLDVHHAYDPVGNVLYLGTGEARRQDPRDRAISRFAGTGFNAGTSMGGFNGDYRLATDADLNQPRGVAVNPNGDLYIADTWNHRVRWVGSDGIIRPLAGGGNPADGLGDGRPALEAKLWQPYDVAVAPDGSVYFADRDSHRIRRVGPDGIIRTVAGSGPTGPNQGAFDGEGSVATMARLNQPHAIAFGPDGSLYIADTANHRVRQVGPDGRIHTLAGTGVAGHNGDDLPALQTQLRFPTGVAVGPEGSVYVADRDNGRIRRVWPDGRCETIVGAGELWPDDGVLARNVRLEVTRVTVDPEGRVCFSGARWGYRIYRVGFDGLLTTIAGPRAHDIVPVPAYRGDGGPAVGSAMNQPNGLAISPEGTLCIADCFNHTIRQVSLPLPGFDGQGFGLASEDGARIYEFDADGRHRRTVDTLTGAALFRFTYDARGWLAAVQDGDQNVTTVERAPDGAPTALVAPFGQRTLLATDGAGYLSRIADPLGHGFDLTYTGGGLLATLTTPPGRVATFTYDDLGRLVKDENAGCCFTELSWRQTNSTSTVTLTSAEGLQAEYAIGFLPSGEQTQANGFPDGTTNRLVLGTDGSEQVTYGDRSVSTRVSAGDPRFGLQSPFARSFTLTTPGGRTFTQTRERTVSLTNVLDPLSLVAMTNRVVVNAQTNLTIYDATTHTATFISPEDRRRVQQLDAQGRLRETQATGIEPVTLAYDSRGCLAQVNQGGRRLGFGFAADTGWLESVTNAEDQVTAYTRDAAGRVTHLTQPNRSVWSFEYDAANNLIALTEPDGTARHTLTYTPENLVESYRSPLGAVERFTYDRGRRPTGRQSPTGQWLRWVYNPRGQLAAFHIADSSDTFTYDPGTGILAESLSRDGQRVAYRWDASLLTQTRWSGAVTGTVDYAYDNDLRLARVSYAGLILTNVYDRDNGLTQIGTLEVDRDPRHGLVTALRDGSFQIVYTHNPYGQVATRTARHGQTHYDAAYDYDSLGRVRQTSETIGANTTTWTYDYDPLGQLLTVQRDGTAVESYAYDAVGNRIAMTNVLTGQTVPLGGYEFNADHQVLRVGATTLTYDPDGRLRSQTVQGAVTVYRYHADGTLAEVTLPDGRAITYLHDTRGRRIARAVDGVRTHGWLYGEGLLPLAELDGQGQLRTTFIYAHMGSAIAMIRNGLTYHIVADHRGTPRLVIDPNGGVLKRLDYDAFGNRIADSNPAFDLPFGFCGGLGDPDVPLLRFGARDYHPGTGRWTAKDPTLFRTGDFNLYTYAGNDPVNYVDRSGQATLIEVAVVVGVGFLVYRVVTDKIDRAKTAGAQAEQTRQSSVHYGQSIDRAIAGQLTDEDQKAYNAYASQSSQALTSLSKLGADLSNPSTSAPELVLEGASTFIPNARGKYTGPKENYRKQWQSQTAACGPGGLFYAPGKCPYAQSK